MVASRAEFPENPCVQLNTLNLHAGHHKPAPNETPKGQSVTVTPTHLKLRHTNCKVTRNLQGQTSSTLCDVLLEWWVTPVQTARLSALHFHCALLQETHHSCSEFAAHIHKVKQKRGTHIWTEPKVESWCKEVLFANVHHYKNADKYSGRAVDAEMHRKAGNSHFSSAALVTVDSRWSRDTGRRKASSGFTGLAMWSLGHCRVKTGAGWSYLTAQGAVRVANLGKLQILYTQWNKGVSFLSVLTHTAAVLRLSQERQLGFVFFLQVSVLIVLCLNVYLCDSLCNR